MSKLDDLIQKYCPDGVEFVRLKDVCIKVCSGGTPSRGNGDYFSGYIPWLRTQEVDFKDIYDTEIKITKEAVKNSSAKVIPENCVIVAMYGATAGKAGINKIPLTTNQACCNLQIDPQKALYKYVYYWVCNEYENIKALGQGSQNNINAQIVKDYPIPVPPLPVQEEIVRILDNFTELQAELQAELQKRKQQYNFYRGKLLSFEGREDIQWKTLGEVMTISRGASPRPIQSFLTNDENGIPWIKIGDTTPESKYVSSTKEKVTKEGAAKSRFLKRGSFILSNSMSFGRPYILEIDGCIHDGWISMCDFEEHLNSDFLYHLLRSDVVQGYWISKANSGGAVTNLNSDIVRSTLIPIPSLKEQIQSSAILDRFDTLTNDLTQGLPAEIEKRKQQYEYYRDKLLTFKRI